MSHLRATIARLSPDRIKKKEKTNNQQNRSKKHNQPWMMPTYWNTLIRTRHCNTAGGGDTNNQPLTEEKTQQKKHESFASNDCTSFW